MITTLLVFEQLNPAPEPVLAKSALAMSPNKNLPHHVLMKAEVSLLKRSPDRRRQADGKGEPGKLIYPLFSGPYHLLDARNSSRNRLI